MIRAATCMLPFLLAIPAIPCTYAQQAPTPADAKRTWTPDNGNGTFTNPLFNDEFSDPDIIRVGDDFYMTGTTMHVMPGLPVLHSKDLVNWKLLGYAFDRLEMGPEYRLESGRDTYGQGIWAPAIRYHAGTFYIFSNINGYGLQVFTATDPKGPWKHHKVGGTIHDLGVLFEDDGRIFAVHGYDEVKLIELKRDLTGYVEGSDHVIIPKGSTMGEGHHFYKINGKYYIVSANYSPVGRMTVARADRIDGPYETVTISARETMGTQRGWWGTNVSIGGKLPKPGDNVGVENPAASMPNAHGAVPLHQGGIVDLPNGDWWGWSMMDTRSMGRTTFLSPVTWQDGWPYFGLPNNLGRTPRTWIKPATGVSTPPTPTYVRDDDFSGPKLQPVWQWNHVPVDDKWSLRARRGFLRLQTLPGEDFMRARNSLTQRAIAPVSIATTKLDATGLKPGDIAGLGLLNLPYQWLGVVRDGRGYALRFYDMLGNRSERVALNGSKVQLRVEGDYDQDTAKFSYSTDGRVFRDIGGPVRLAYQIKTFQGVRYTLFAFNEAGKAGGHADFDSFTVDEPLADRSSNIPFGKVITITNVADGKRLWSSPHGMLHSADAGSERASNGESRFRVIDRGQGRVALQAMDGSGFLTVVGIGMSADVRLSKTETKDSLFQWQDMLRGQFMLLSLRTNRLVGVDPGTGEPYGADWTGSAPDRRNGTVLHWELYRPE